MKKLRAFAAVLLLGLVAVAVWLAGAGRDGQPEEPTMTDQEAAYDYEAVDVVVRQMGPDGRQVYQIDAQEITQLPRSGEISARGLVMLHDPPGTTPGGSSRLTLQAERALLPAEGGVVTLQGAVHASGRPEGSNLPLDLRAERLDYDMDQQILRSDEEVTVSWGGTSFRGRALRVNIRTGDWGYNGAIHATLAP